MTDAAHGRLASIIIPCWNQLEFTRVCLSTLVRHTRAPWELIVIDNSPQMAQMDADEKTGNTGNPETNGHQTGSAGRPDAFHLRSSAKSADKRFFCLRESHDDREG